MATHSVRPNGPPLLSPFDFPSSFLNQASRPLLPLGLSLSLQHLHLCFQPRPRPARRAARLRPRLVPHAIAAKRPLRRLHPTRRLCCPRRHVRRYFQGHARPLLCMSSVDRHIHCILHDMVLRLTTSPRNAAVSKPSKGAIARLSVKCSDGRGLSMISDMP